MATIIAPSNSNGGLFSNLLPMIGQAGGTVVGGPLGGQIGRGIGSMAAGQPASESMIGAIMSGIGTTPQSTGAQPQSAGAPVPVYPAPSLQRMQELEDQWMAKNRAWR